MKKKILIFILWMGCCGALQASTTDGRTEHGPFVRPFMVIGRGLGNLAGIAVEPFATLGREFEMHHWEWPVTYPLRLINNILVRASSAVVDIAINPWIVPFTDDISPLTEPMGLPNYPWQKH